METNSQIASGLRFAQLVGIPSFLTVVTVQGQNILLKCMLLPTFLIKSLHFSGADLTNISFHRARKRPTFSSPKNRCNQIMLFYAAYIENTQSGLLLWLYSQKPLDPHLLRV